MHLRTNFKKSIGNFKQRFHNQRLAFSLEVKRDNADRRPLIETWMILEDWNTNKTFASIQHARMKSFKLRNNSFDLAIIWYMRAEAKLTRKGY